MKASAYQGFLARFGGLLVAGLLLLSLVLGCRSSSSSANCSGEVTFEGTRFTGQAGNLEDAQKFACNNYCLEADAEFDAHYHIWLDSPKGRAAGSPSKKESIYKDKDLLDYLTKDCAMKCVASVKAGTLKGTAKCQ